MATLHRISKACDDPQRKADVVFIHGLGGDAFGTWRHGDGDDTSWPHWLAHEFEGVGVWSVDYAASKFKAGRFLKWFVSGLSDKWGYAMPLPKRAGNVLRTLMLNGIGERPLLQICHSLGGLVTKEMLRQAAAPAADQEYRRVGKNTRAVLFLATPHRGATLASIGDRFKHVFGTTVAIRDLRAFDRHLLELLGWYSGYAPDRYDTVSYTEERGVGDVVRIVDEFSADPGVGTVVSVDEDHLSIAKPRDSGHAVVLEARRMLRNVLHASVSPQGEGTPKPTNRGNEVLTRTGPAEEAPRAPSPIPPNLRLAEYGFFGRTEQQARLLQRLRAGQTTAVVGGPGLGKTALVTKVLRTVLGDTEAAQRQALAGLPFPDGIVFLDLYALHGQADPAWEALASAVAPQTPDDAGATRAMPARERAVAACRGKRFLLVVEGGEEARGTADPGDYARTTRRALLDPLALQGPVLWLTRSAAQSNKNEWIRIDTPLGVDDARDLFDAIAGADVPRTVRDEALEALHGHPLAITWVAALIAREDEPPDLLLADLRRQPSLLQLNDPEQPHHTLQWLFDRSLRGLDADARRSLLAAGLLGADAFPLDAIAAGTGLDDGAQREALRACVQAHLLRWQKDDGGVALWRFGHALAYGYAREQARVEPETAAALLPGLAGWAHTTLEVGLAADAPTEATVAAPHTLVHALALMAVDTPPGLWQSLVGDLLYRFSNRFIELGQLTSAMAMREATERWLVQAQSAQPQAVQWLRESAACYDRLGDLDLIKGDLSGAQRHYANALAISERLAAQHPDDAENQRDLRVCRIKLGQVEQVQGNLLSAERYYVDALVIAERIAAQDPANDEWQRDLSSSRNRVGDVQEARGDLPGAQRHYADALVVIERIAAQDPTNAEWQSDLVVCHIKLGDVQRAQGDLSSAQRHYTDALVVAERLAAKDPANTTRERDLSVTHERLGDVKRVQGDLYDAKRHYTDAFVIAQRLAAKDLANARWQRDLAVSRFALATVCAADGDTPGALTHLQAAREILQALRQRAPEYPQFQRDLAIVEQRIAALEGDGAAP
jgi:tetratricopeptide (TPR) repeat protein